MSDGPEFIEEKITVADIRRKSIASALLLGALLPGGAAVLPEEPRRVIAAVQNAPLAGAVQYGPRMWVQHGVVLAYEPLLDVMNAKINA